MKIKQLNLGTLKKEQLKLQKKQIADAKKRRFEEHIKKIAGEIYPKDLFMRDRNVAKNTSSEKIIDKILYYFSILDSDTGVWAPWSKIK